MEVGEVQTPESSLGTTNTPPSPSSPRDEHAEGGQISPTRKQRRTRRSQSLNPQGLLSKQNKTLEFITNQTFRIFAQTIIQGRLVQASSTATEDDVPGGGAGSNEVFSAEGSSDWLNLSVDCLWKVDKDLQRFWQYRDNDTRRVKTVQLTIDIFAREESSSPAGSRSPNKEDTSESQDRRAQNRHRPSDFLLERWCLEYTNEANPDAASPTLNNKHTLVLLRSVAAMICLLPCHKLVRLCKRHPTSYSICYSINDLNSVSRITSLKASRDRDATSTSISSVLEWSTNDEPVSTHPQKEKEKEQEKALSGNNDSRSSFKFGEISTKMGSLTVSVEYRTDISRFQKIKSSGIATFIIPDYSPNASSNVTQPNANKTSASQTASTSRAEDPFQPSSFHKIEPSDKAPSPPSSAPRKMSNVDLYLDEYFEKKMPDNKKQPSTTPSTIATSAAIPTPRTRRRSAANALASEDDLTTGAEAGDASYPPSLFSLTSPPSVPSLLLTSPPFSQMPDTVGHMATIAENEAISGESSGRARLRSSNPQPIPSASSSSSSSATSSRHHQRKQTKPSAASCPPCHYGGQNPFSSHFSTSPLSASVASLHNRNEHVQMVPSSMPTTIPHSKSMPPQRQSTASSPSPFSPTSLLLNNYQQKQKQNQFPHPSSSPFASSGPLSQTPPIGSGMYGSQCFYMDDPPLVDEEEDDSEWLAELQKVCAIDPPLATISTLPTSSSFLSPFSSSPPTSSSGASATKPITTTSSFPEASLLFSPSLSSPPSPDIDLLLCSQEGAFTTPNREIGEQVGSFVLICSQPPVLKLFKKTTSEKDVHSVDLSQFQMVIDSLADWRDQSNDKKANVAKKVQRAPSTIAKQHDRPSSSFLRFNYNFNTTAPKPDNQPRHEDLMKHYEEDDPLSNLALDQDSFFDNLSGPQNRTISSNHFFPSSSSSSRYSKGGGRRSENGGEEEEDEMRRRPSRYWDDYDDSRLSLATDGVMDLSLSDLIQE